MLRRVAVYVERSVADAFVERLAERARAIEPADPRLRTTYMGPVIDADAVTRFERAIGEAEAAVRCWPVVVVAPMAIACGHYVEASVVRASSWLWSTELFVPLVAVEAVDDLDEALTLANDTPLGLTAGFFSAEEAEIDHFLARIEAGVVYVNRRAGATTGAWPGVQPFGGWKGSGTAGKAGGGPYYSSSTCASRAERSWSRDHGSVVRRARGADVPALVTELPGPEAKALIDRDLAVSSPSMPRVYPLVPRRRLRDRGRRRQPVPRPERRHRRERHRAQPPARRGRDRGSGEAFLHYCSSDFYPPVYGELCERLAELAPFGGQPARVFLGNSGTEVVEGAIKLARHHTAGRRSSPSSARSTAAASGRSR